MNQQFMMIFLLHKMLKQLKETNHYGFLLQTPSLKRHICAKA